MELSFFLFKAAILFKGVLGFLKTNIVKIETAERTTTPAITIPAIAPPFNQFEDLERKYGICAAI